MQPDNIMPQQYTNGLDAISFKIADGYDEGTLNEVFIEGGNSGICHNLRDY